MSDRVAEYRLDGIYRQRQEGFFMQRVKLAAGVISADQARAVASASIDFGKGTIHLTTRGSMEIHWLTETDLPAVKRALAAVGLTSRGACGGAVRGVTCASQGAVGFPEAETMAGRIHRHFTANPRFERLPKKFKIGVEADVTSRRHLIQDVGLVLAEGDDNASLYDVYVAGGLGREPQPGFLFENGVVEGRIIPLIEAIASVYTANTPAGKRLKHLIREVGEAEFRRLVALEPSAAEELPSVSGLPENLTPVAGVRLIAPVQFGELSSAQLNDLADIAAQWSAGFLMVTADQDIAFHLSDGFNSGEADSALQRAGFGTSQASFRVCPGSHQCRVGLSPTRDIARSLIEVMGPAAKGMSWALSGCPNSCTQPQLADAGIITAALVKDEDGERAPRFDLYRGDNQGFGVLVEHSLTLKQLCRKVQEIG